MSVQSPAVRVPTPGTTGVQTSRSTERAPSSTVTPALTPTPANNTPRSQRVQDGFSSSDSRSPTLLGASDTRSSALLGGDSVPATALHLLLSRPASGVQPAAFLALSPVVPPGKTQASKTVSVPFQVNVQGFIQLNGRPPKRDELLALLNDQFLRQHPKALEQKWTDPNHPTDAEIAGAIKGGKMVVNVELEAKRPAGSKEAAEADKDFQGLGAGDREWLTAEAERQYGKQTQGSGKPTTPKAQEFQDDLRRELTRRFKDVEGLPPHLRDFLLKGTSDFKWDPDAARRLSEKLADLSPEDLADYLSKTTGFTNDWGELEKSIDAYRNHRAQRAETSDRVRELQTRLYTPVELYKEYKDFLFLKSVSGPDSGVTLQNLQDAEDKLNVQLQAYGFKNVEAFGAAINDFKQAFQKDLLERGLERLDEFEHHFVQAERRYADPSALYEELTQARTALAQADKLRKKAETIENPPNSATSVPQGDPKKLRQDANSLYFEAEQRLATLAAKHPVLRNKEFAAKLAQSSPGDFKRTLMGEISQRRKDIADTRKNIQEDPRILYQMKPLLDGARSVHGMDSGSLFGHILDDHLAQQRTQQLVLGAATAAVCVGAGLLSAGGGWVAAGTLAGSAIFAGYEARESWKQYSVDKAAFGAGMTTEEPSMAWAVLATAGAVAELGGAVKALRVLGSMKEAIQGFNQTNDLVRLEQRLKSLPGVTPGLKSRVMEAAKNEQKLKQQVEGLLTTGPLQPGKLPAEQLGKLSEISRSLAERGDESFGTFMRELQSKNVIKGNPPPETLKQLKQAFEDGVQQARNARNAAKTTARQELLETLGKSRQPPTPTRTPTPTKPTPKPQEAVKPATVKPTPVKPQVPPGDVDGAMKDVNALNTRWMDDDDFDPAEFSGGLLKAFEKSGGDPALGRMLKSLSEENPSVFRAAFGGDPAGVLLRVASSKDPNLVSYAKRLLTSAKEGRLPLADLPTALTSAERLSKLPSAGTVRVLENKTGAVGTFFEGTVDGKSTLFKGDKNLKLTLDSEETVVRGLEPYGGPEFRGRFRVEDPNTGVWRDVVGMEKIKGIDLQQLMDLRAAGKPLPFPISDMHVKALQELEARLAKDGKHLFDARYGNIMLTMDPKRPVVPIDMPVQEGVKESGGMTMGGRPITDSVKELVGLPSETPKP